MKTNVTPWRPTAFSAIRLFGFGATVGPVVDSVHNQCLLVYDDAPISISSPFASDGGLIFASSWYVLPLLGIAYLILGGVLPRIVQGLIDKTPLAPMATESPKPSNTNTLRDKAVLAVSTTTMIIKLSDLLERNSEAASMLSAFVPDTANQHIFVLMCAALAQWAVLDGSLAALITASITSVGGPLSELPFVAAGIWTYLSQAADYFPLAGLEDGIPMFDILLGKDYQSLGLSSITGPCYFAVTMDAIAVGRWIDDLEKFEGLEDLETS